VISQTILGGSENTKMTHFPLIYSIQTSLNSDVFWLSSVSRPVLHTLPHILKTSWSNNGQDIPYTDFTVRYSLTCIFYTLTLTFGAELFITYW